MTHRGCLIEVRPGMDRWLHTGTMWAEWTFRGRALGLFQFEHDLNRSDWRLIHRHDEARFTASPHAMADITLPSRFPLPPLQVGRGYPRRWKVLLEIAACDACRNCWLDDRPRRTALHGRRRRTTRTCQCASTRRWKCCDLSYTKSVFLSSMHGLCRRTRMSR
jgi:hypothetical protein